jgi:2'-5' RNA ligase
VTRLFVAIDLPEEAKERLATVCHGVPGARWVRDRQFHLTLRFLGGVDGPTERAVSDSLRAVRCEPFTLRIVGVGHFPPRGTPRVLWAGVERSAALLELHRQVEKYVRRAGLPPEDRKFAAHVTLARLTGTPLPRALSFLAEHAGLRSEPFRVERFDLFSSVLAGEGSLHTVEESYPLSGARPGPEAGRSDLPAPGPLS